jgi:hypothetical protein
MPLGAAEFVHAGSLVGVASCNLLRVHPNQAAPVKAPPVKHQTVGPFPLNTAVVHPPSRYALPVAQLARSRMRTEPTFMTVQIWGPMPGNVYPEPEQALELSKPWMSTALTWVVITINVVTTSRSLEPWDRTGVMVSGMIGTALLKTIA